MKREHKKKQTNLIQTWIYVVTVLYDMQLKDAVAQMNEDLDSKHSVPRVREWSRQSEDSGRGSRLPRVVRLYMATTVINYVLCAVGVDTDVIKRIDTNKLVTMLH